MPCRQGANQSKARSTQGPRRGEGGGQSLSKNGDAKHARLPPPSETMVNLSAKPINSRETLGGGGRYRRTRLRSSPDSFNNPRAFPFSRLSLSLPFVVRGPLL